MTAVCRESQQFGQRPTKRYFALTTVTLNTRMELPGIVPTRLRAVPEARRDDELPLSADTHSRNARDASRQSRCPFRERTGTECPLGHCVELRSVRQPTRVVHRQRLTRRDKRAGADDDVTIVQAGCRFCRRRDVDAERGRERRCFYGRRRRRDRIRTAGAYREERRRE